MLKIKRKALNDERVVGNCDLNLTSNEVRWNTKISESDSPKEYKTTKAVNAIVGGNLEN